MKVLKIDIEIPFWCSFKDFGTVNSHQTYPFPPPPTLFGMLLNAFGKPALHTVDDESARLNLQREYFAAFAGMKFAIIVKTVGYPIDDYCNIMKRARGSDQLEQALRKPLQQRLDILLENEFSEKKQRNEKVDEIRRAVGKYKIIKEDLLESTVQALGGISSDSKDHIVYFVKNYWAEKVYELNKSWQRTQITRQRLIQSEYSVILHSSNEGQYSIENCCAVLVNPRRPLYCGDSDDIAILRVGEITEIADSRKSSEIDSVIPGVIPNARVVSIPTALRHQIGTESRKVCSIPHGNIGTPIDAFRLEGENFVFI